MSELGGDVQLPSLDDSEIQEQLRLLDRQMTMWARAVREAEERLGALAATEVRADQPARVDEPVETVGEAAEKERVPESGSDGGERGEPGVVVVEEPQAELAAQPLDATPAREASHEGAPAAPVARAAREPDEEDAALLASLDPETLMRVRVRQRVSAQPKSIRELLDELRATTGKGRKGNGPE